MPNQRRAGQTFVGFQADEELVRQIDHARKFKDRSQFLREAVAEKLKKLGIEIPEELIYAPPRGMSLAEKSPTYGKKKKQKPNSGGI